MKLVRIPCSKERANLMFKLWKEKNKTIANRFYSKSCQVCGRKRPIHIHHINGDKRDNRIINFKAVCSSCHRRIHLEQLQVSYRK